MKLSTVGKVSSWSQSWTKQNSCTVINRVKVQTPAVFQKVLLKQCYRRCHSKTHVHKSAWFRGRSRHLSFWGLGRPANKTYSLCENSLLWSLIPFILISISNDIEHTKASGTGWRWALWETKMTSELLITSWIKLFFFGTTNNRLTIYN